MKLLLTLCWSLLLTLLAIPAQAAYTTVSTTSTTLGPLTKTTTVVQDGTDPVNRFTMYRIAKTSGTPFGAIILMPGGNANFSSYEFDDLDNYQNSLVGYLANLDVEVWGYDPRSKGITSATCSTPLSCAYLVPWGIATIVQDADYIRGRVVATTGITPAIGGLSLGAMTSSAAVNANPTGYSGLLFWEGLLYSTDLLNIAGNTVNCTQAQAELALGVYNNPTSATIFALPAPLFRVIATTAQPSPPGYVTGYTLLTGNALAYTYANTTRLAKFLTTFNPVESMSVQKDITCSIAGDRTFTNNLGAFTNPLYVIRSGHGFGAYMMDQVGLFGSTLKDTSNYQSVHGHADAYLSSSHVTYIEQPVYTWLRNVVFP